MASKTVTKKDRQRRKIDGRFYDLRWQEYSDGTISLNAYRPGEGYPLKFVTEDSREQCLARFVMFVRGAEK